MKSYPLYIKTAAILLSLGICVTAMILASDLLIPFCWSVLLALLILPLDKWLEKKLKHRGISAVLSILILVIVIGGVLYLLSAQLVNLANELPQVFSKLNRYLLDFRNFVEAELGIPYQDQPAELVNRLSDLSQQAVGTLSKTLSQTLKAIVLIGIMPVYIFFLLYYRNRFNHFLVLLSGRKDEGSWLFKISKASGVVQDYISGMLIVTLIVAVLVFTGLVVLDIKHALFFALLVAVLNLIPYIGVFLASFVTILYVFITKDSLAYPLIILAFLWGVQLFENNLITPYVVGKQVQLNPLAVILAIILGGMIWGVSGMVLFIPILGGIKVIFDETEELRPYGYLLGDREAQV